MPIKYKINILEELEKKGYNAYRLRKEQIISQATIENLRKDGYISFEVLGRICEILGLQPADIIEYSPDTDKKDPDPKEMSEFFRDEDNSEVIRIWRVKQRSKHN